MAARLGTRTNRERALTGSAIRTDGLSRTFHAAGHTIHALTDLTINVERGTVFGFLGPNGAGKTTTIRLLLGLIEPTAGAASVLDNDVSSNAEFIRENCGALLEYDGLYERLTARHNLEFFARIWRMPRDARNDRIEQLLRHFGLWDRAEEPAGKFSRGMKRKLAVARALLHSPRIAFLDEPTAGLDPAAAAGLRDELSRLVRGEGLTVFLTTHNLNEAEKLCDQIGIIRNGRLIACGTPAQLKSAWSSATLEIRGHGLSAVDTSAWTDHGFSGINQSDTRITARVDAVASVAPFVRAAINAGAEIEEVIRGHGSLEDVYLALTREDANS